MQSPAPVFDMKKEGYVAMFLAPRAGFIGSGRRGAGRHLNPTKGGGRTPQAPSGAVRKFSPDLIKLGAIVKE